MSRAFDVIVIGAGVIGRAVAFELARRDVTRVALVDDGRPGRASVAAAGYLPVASMRSPRGLLFDLGRASLALYPGFLRAIEEAGGGPVGFEEVGALQLAATKEQAVALRARVEARKSLGMEAEAIEALQLGEVVPGLASGFAVGALFRREARVDPARLCGGLETACARLGVHLEPGRATVAPEGTAVRVDLGGAAWSAGQVVLCGGIWASESLRPLGITLPVRPARGEIIEVRVASPLARVIDDDVLILPGGRTPRGHLVRVGGGVEFDDSPAPTVRERERLLRRAARLWPPIAGGEVTGHWAGVRACSALRHPIVARVPDAPGLIVASGHHRSGFLLAPITARVVAALALGEPVPVAPRSIAW